MFKTEMIFKTFSIGDIEIDFIVSFKLVLFPKFNPLSQKKRSHLSYAIIFKLIFFMKKFVREIQTMVALNLRELQGFMIIGQWKN